MYKCWASWSLAWFVLPWFVLGDCRMVHGHSLCETEIVGEGTPGRGRERGLLLHFVAWNILAHVNKQPESYWAKYSITILLLCLACQADNSRLLTRGPCMEKRTSSMCMFVFLIVFLTIEEFAAKYAILRKRKKTMVKTIPHCNGNTIQYSTINVLMPFPIVFALFSRWCHLTVNSSTQVTDIWGPILANTDNHFSLRFIK